VGVNHGTGGPLLLANTTAVMSGVADHSLTVRWLVLSSVILKLGISKMYAGTDGLKIKSWLTFGWMSLKTRCYM